MLGFQCFDQLRLLRFGRLTHGLPEIVQDSFKCEPLHGGSVLEKHAADAQLWWPQIWPGSYVLLLLLFRFFGRFYFLWWLFLSSPFFSSFFGAPLRTNSALRNHVTGSRQREREAPTRRPPVLDSVRMPMWKRPGLMPRLAAVFLDEIFSRDSYSSSSETTKRKTKLFFSLFPRSLKFLRRHGSMG